MTKLLVYFLTLFSAAAINETPVRYLYYMKHFTLILFVVLLCGVAHGQGSQRQRLEMHVYTLASDSLQGREAGTENGRRAADYIRSQWRQMGLKSFVGNDDYSKPFSRGFCNLVAVIEGDDPVLKNEYIVVGAHYDHLGVRGGQIYNGADDNASGSACVIEMARQLLAQQGELKRSVIICAFDAEEKGLLGSKEMVEVLRNLQMLDRVKLMLSVDMVGWYGANDKLALEGAGTLEQPWKWLKPECFGMKLKVDFVSFETSIFTATDTEPFAEEGIPTLAVSTGLKSPYHKPQDDADLIDYEGLDRITDYLTALTVAASQKEGVLASGNLSPKHRHRRFEFALALGYNTCHLRFPDATFEGKSNVGFQGGLMMQYNFNKVLALRINALYDYSHCPLPAAGDAFGKGFGLEQHSLLVPVTLLLGVNDAGFGAHIGLGGFYGRVFDGRFYGDVPATNPVYDVNDNQAGLVFNVGFRFGGRWQLDCNWYHQLTELFDTSGGLPRAKRSIYAATLGYIF